MGDLITKGYVRKEDTRPSGKTLFIPHHGQGVMKKFFGSGSTMTCSRNCDQALIRSSWGSVKYTYISELMLWLHWDNFWNVK